jgi:menaquinone-9 beta-reductase
MFDTDLLVIGGGPAGLAAAIAARRQGLRVLVADARRPPIDKACGEGLMPDALEAAQRIGIEIPATLGVPFRGIHFLGRDHDVAADFPDGWGRGVRRVSLHALLCEQAAGAGAEFSWGFPVTGFDGESVMIHGQRLRPRWIAGADGGHSSVRRWTGLDEFRRERRRFGFRRHYAVAPWNERMEMHWGDGCQFYVTPVSEQEVCVVLMSRDSHLRLKDALPQFPRLAARLGADSTTAAVTEERGALSSTCRLHAVTRGRVALIGDASGRVDAITGDGLCLAFRQADALARSLAAGDLRLYEAEHRRLSRRPMFMADFMLTMERREPIQDRALRALASRPWLFENLLAMHVGKLNVRDFIRTGLALGWRLAWV